MEQSTEGVASQHKVVALGLGRHDMIAALRVMRAQLAELMETIAQHLGEP